MKIKIFVSRRIAGAHRARGEIVDVPPDLARYLCGVGVAAVEDDQTADVQRKALDTRAHKASR